MELIKQILKGKAIGLFSQGKKLNETWERAKEFGSYVGLSTPFVLRLFKNFGANNVLNLRSWIKDVPYDQKKGLYGLIIWKLKQPKCTPGTLATKTNLSGGANGIKSSFLKRKVLKKFKRVEAN